MRAAIFVLMLLAASLPAGLVRAGVTPSEGEKDEESRVAICYNYGCAQQDEVLLDRATLRAVQRRLANAADADAERAALSKSIARLYLVAARQTPVAADRAGNFLDAGVDGRMDCIDHSTSTTRLLRVLEARGWLRFHRVVEPARRARFIFQHYSATIEEVQSEAPPADPAADADSAPSPARYVVDSWFVDNGEPAVVMPLAEWLNGGGPSVH